MVVSNISAIDPAVVVVVGEFLRGNRTRGARLGRMVGVVLVAVVVGIVVVSRAGLLEGEILDDICRRISINDTTSDC